MVQIWLMETYPFGDPRLPHHRFPPKKLNADELTKKTGTLYYKLDTDDSIAMSKRITLMKMERKFKREDTFTLDAQTTLDFEEKISELFEETEASEDQARMILEGSAYYDVEGKDGEWIRILCEFGDLIIIPAGRSYRMTTTPKVGPEALVSLERAPHIFDTVSSAEIVPGQIVANVERSQDTDSFVKQPEFEFQNFVKIRRFFKDNE